MKRRTGMTLVEVLVAIFIMGIGLIALLTLFPIGVLRMAQAIRDDRCASAAMNARDVAIIHNVGNDPLVVGTPDMFVNPLPGAPGVLLNADPYGESYPVLVDPIGSASGGESFPGWVGFPPTGGAQAGFLCRRTPSFAQTPATRQQWFTVTDDIPFESQLNPPTQVPGTPKQFPGIARDTRYTWAYLLRRPQTSDRSVVDCSIVVFESRPQIVLKEDSRVAYFDPIKNTVLFEITPTTPAPELRAGNWILDNTYHPRGNFGSAHATFYRVVAVDNVTAPGGPPVRTFVRCEVQQSIKGFTNPSTSAFIFPSGADPFGNTVCQGTAIVIEGVAEVVDVGPVRLP